MQQYFEKYSRNNIFINNDLRILLHENNSKQINNKVNLLSSKSKHKSSKLLNEGKNNKNIHDMRKYDSRIQYLAFYDICCNITAFVALVTAGSGTYQLVYSSIIIITAAFRHFLLPNKQLTIQQWLACFVVTLGLLLSAMGNHRFVSNDPNNNIANSRNQIEAELNALKMEQIESKSSLNAAKMMQEPTALHAHTWTEYFAGLLCCLSFFCLETRF